MASIPGYTLEDYVAWLWDVVVIDQAEANVSVGMAEMLGNVKPRPRLTKEQFAPLLALYEPYRDRVEEMLVDFDEEEHGSWRDYGCVVEAAMDADPYEEASALLKSIVAAQ